MENINYTNLNLTVDLNEFERYVKDISNLILRPPKYIFESAVELIFRYYKYKLFKNMSHFASSLKNVKIFFMTNIIISLKFGI